MANETTVQSAWWVRAIALLPLPLLHGIARGLAFLALNVLPYRPKVVRGNLSTAFPEWDARTLRRTMRDFYRGYADVMLELLKAARLEPEELRDELREYYERIITPADWDSRYEIYRGATFNLAHTLDQMLHLRPHNRFEDLDGMYLVGGGTHPGSGLPVIFESARISSRLLLEDLGVQIGRAHV